MNVPKLITDKQKNRLISTLSRDLKVQRLINELIIYYNENSDIILDQEKLFDIGNDPDLYDRVLRFLFIIDENPLVTKAASDYIKRTELSGTGDIPLNDNDLTILIYHFLRGVEVETENEEYLSILEEINSNDNLREILESASILYTFTSLGDKYRNFIDLYRSVSVENEDPNTIRFLYQLMILAKKDQDFKNYLQKWIVSRYLDPNIINSDEIVESDYYADVMQSVDQSVKQDKLLLLRLYELIPSFETDPKKIKARNSLIEGMEDNPYKISYPLQLVRCYSCPTPLSHIRVRDIIRSIYQSHSPIRMYRPHFWHGPDPSLGRLIRINSYSKTLRDEVFLKYVSERQRGNKVDYEIMLDNKNLKVDELKIALRPKEYKPCCVARLVNPELQLRQSKQEMEIIRANQEDKPATKVVSVGRRTNIDEDEKIRQLVKQITLEYQKNPNVSMPGVYITEPNRFYRGK